MATDGRLITGPGGFIGRNILPHYYDREDCTLYLLEHGRFVARLREYLDRNLPASARPRFHVIEGDVTQPGLGLDSATRDVLQDCVSRCLHLAAVYHLSVPQDVAQRVNVEGTKNVLDFLETCPNMQRLGFASTTAIVGSYSGVYLEDDFDKGQAFKNHYEETKFASERLVRERWDRIPSVIYRPGYVVGHSRTGAIEKIDGPYYAFTMIKRRLHLAAPNAPHVKFHAAPVDYVAAAMYHLLEDADTANQAYHLTDPEPVSYNEFYKLACEALGTFKPVLWLPPALIKPVMRIPFTDRITGVPYTAFQYSYHPIAYDTSKARAALERHGVRCPPLRDYIGVLARYFLEHYRDPALRRGDWLAATT